MKKIKKIKIKINGKIKSINQDSTLSLVFKRSDKLVLYFTNLKLPFILIFIFFIFFIVYKS